MPSLIERKAINGNFLDSLESVLERARIATEQYLTVLAGDGRYMRRVSPGGLAPVYNVATLFGAVGDDSTLNSTQINEAIAAAAGAGGGVVLVPFVPGAADYRVGATIELAEGVALVLDSGVRLKPTLNTNVIQMAPGAALLGPGTIDTEVIGASFGNAVVYLDGADGYGLVHGTYIGGGLRVFGTTDRVGLGIHVDVADTASDNVTFVQVDNVTIADFNVGIRFDVVKPASGVSWANGNQFNNVVIARCLNGIHMDGGDDLRANGNTFSNIQVQVASQTLRVLHCRASTNQFVNMMIWDPDNSANEDLVRFTNDSFGNYFGGVIWRKHIRDFGKDNIIDNRYAQPPLRTTIVPPGNIQSPSFTPVDDYLAMCHVRSGVTVTETGTSPTTGVTGNFFRTARNSYVQYNSGDGIATTAAVIEVDLGETLNSLHAVGINFVQNRMAQEVKIEAWDGSAWQTLYETTQNGNNQVMVDTQQSASLVNHSYRADKLRYTIEVPFHASGDVWVERLWAYYSDKAGEGYVRADTGILYGSLDANSQRITNPKGGTTGNRPGSPTTGEAYFDTTLSLPIWWDGANWIDAAGTTV